MNRVGLYFGSFDPFHIAHYWIVKFVLYSKKVDKIWIIPSVHNPLKKSDTSLPIQQRIQIISESIKHDSNIKVLDIELRMPSPSYTYRTLQKLKSLHTKKHFFLLMGMDNVNELHLWKNYRQILNMVNIIAYPRLGINKMNTFEFDNIFVMEGFPLTSLSSTMLRDKIYKDKEYSALLRNDAYQLIAKKGWYKN